MSTATIFSIVFENSSQESFQDTGTARHMITLHTRTCVSEDHWCQGKMEREREWTVSALPPVHTGHAWWLLTWPGFSGWEEGRNSAAGTINNINWKVIRSFIEWREIIFWGSSLRVCQVTDSKAHAWVNRSLGARWPNTSEHVHSWATRPTSAKNSCLSLTERGRQEMRLPRMTGCHRTPLLVAPC